jgi:hypothetical protein
MEIHRLVAAGELSAESGAQMLYLDQLQAENRRAAIRLGLLVLLQACLFGLWWVLS